MADILVVHGTDHTVSPKTKEDQSNNTVTTYWLVIRNIKTMEAIGIAKWSKGELWYDPGDLIEKEPAGFHHILDLQVGRYEWTYETISKAEWETYRDLHGLRILGEDKLEILGEE